MAKTGMSGAPNPKMTGSSFYNATMAKTKIQEQRQQEELQRQLQNIFGDESGHRQTIDASEAPGAGRSRTHSKDPINEDDQGHSVPYQLPHDSTVDIENMSDINIAASVGHSLETHQMRAHEQLQLAALQASNKHLQPQLTEKHGSTLIEQQYNWLLKDGTGNGVIKEQEFESKSREESHSKGELTYAPSEDQFQQTIRTNGQTLK